MTRTWIFAALALASCGKKSDPKPSSPEAGNRVDATVAITDPGPPPPTEKAGGRGDCKTEYAPAPDRDPNPMCKIDGGTFAMGAPDADTDADADRERPVRRVTLSPYYVDQSIAVRWPR